MPDSTSPTHVSPNVNFLSAASTSTLLDTLAVQVEPILNQTISDSSSSAPRATLPIYVVVPSSISSEAVSRRISSVSTYGVEAVSFDGLLSKLSSALGLKTSSVPHFSQADEQLILHYVIGDILSKKLKLESTASVSSIAKIRRFMSNFMYWHAANVNSLHDDYKSLVDFCEAPSVKEKYPITSEIVSDSWKRFVYGASKMRTTRIPYDYYIIRLANEIAKLDLAAHGIHPLNIIFLSPSSNEQSIRFFYERISENEDINISVINSIMSKNLPEPVFDSDGECIESVVQVLGYNAEGHVILNEMEKMLSEGTLLDDIVIASSLPADKADKIMRAAEQLACTSSPFPSFKLRETRNISVSDTELGKYFIARLFDEFDEDEGLWTSFLYSRYSGIGANKADTDAISSIAPNIPALMRWAWGDKESLYENGMPTETLLSALREKDMLDGGDLMVHEILESKLKGIVSEPEIVALLLEQNIYTSKHVWGDKSTEESVNLAQDILDFLLLCKYPREIEAIPNLETIPNSLASIILSSYSDILDEQDRKVVKAIHDCIERCFRLYVSPSKGIIEGLTITEERLYYPTGHDTKSDSVKEVPTVLLTDWWNVPNTGRRHVIVLDTDMDSERSYLVPDAMQGLEKLALGAHEREYIDRWEQQRETYCGITDILEYASKNPDSSHVSFIYASRSAAAKEVPMSSVLEDVVERLVSAGVYESEKDLPVFAESDMWDREGQVEPGREETSPVLWVSPAVDPACIPSELFAEVLKWHRTDKNTGALAMSPTEINLLWKCPAQWLFSKYGLGYEESSSNNVSLIKGSIIHKGMELFYTDKNRKPGHITAQELESLRPFSQWSHKMAADALEAYESEQTGHVNIGGKEREALIDEVASSLTRLVVGDLEFEPDYIPDPSCAEYKISGMYAGISVQGTIDRIDVKDNGDGTRDVIIVDYKGSIEDYQPVKGIPTQIQMHVYASLYAKEAVNDTVNKIVYKSYKKQKESSKKEATYENKKGNLTEELNWVEDMVRDRIEKMKNGSISPVDRTTKSACKYCPMKDFCSNNADYDGER